MFNYFVTNPDKDIAYPIKKYFKWNVLKRMYLSELDKVKEYYRNRERALNNDNPLVRLINLEYHDTSIDVFAYLGYIDNDIEYLVRQFNFVTNQNKGEILHNVIFENNSQEVFLYVDRQVDPIDMEGLWREYSPIRVISTDITDVNYPTAFRYDHQGSDVSIFEIDVKAMMLQYRYWAKYRLRNDMDVAPNIFLATVVYPNISDSLVDMAIWNRFKKLSQGYAIPESKTKHPMYTIDYTKGIDDVLLNLIKENTDTSIYVSQLLMTIPMIVKDSAYDVLQIDKQYYNRQSKWVLWVSRLDDIVTLHKALGKRGAKLNRQMFRQLPYEAKFMLRSEALYKDILDDYGDQKMSNGIKYIHTHIGKR